MQLQSSTLTLQSLLIFILFIGAGAAQAQLPFVTTWETTVANESITIPTTGDGYSYTVDWGDGETDETTYDGDATHIYETSGVYTVSISGDFPRIYFDNEGDKEKILTIEQWGDQVWISMASAFDGCSNLTYNATDVPDLSQVTDMSFMFSNASQFNGAIGNWDISGMTDVSRMFYNANSFNQPLNSWDVSSVTFMSFMFRGAVLFDQNLNNWDISEVRYLNNMFYGASSFNGIIDSWDVSSVRSMTKMFYEASSFNGAIWKWDMNGVVYMDDMISNSGLSTTNYDAFLMTLSKTDTIATDVSFSGAGLEYCISKEEREILINDFDWVMSGDIENCENITESLFTVVENKANGETIGVLTYNNSEDQEIESVITATDYFSIDASTLMVKVEDRSILDYETNDYIDFGGTIQYSDGSYEEFVVGIIVTDAREAPVIQNQSIAIMDNIASNSIIGTIEVKNPDSDDEYTFEILEGNELEAFAIDSNTGELKISNTDVIDYDFRSLFSLVIRVTDDLGSGEANVDIEVFDDTRRPFVTTWQTSLDGESITIPTWIDDYFEDSYHFMVDWGDGSNNYIAYSEDATHTYANPGIYTVSISGDFPRIYFNNEGDKNKIMTIEQWGDQVWSTMSYAFMGCVNLTYNATDFPDLSKATSTAYMFLGASQFNGAIGEWDVSGITTMSSMFYEASSFNQPLEGWDVSNVSYMNNMFAFATSFSQPLKDWDVSNATSMSYMFYNATSFNQNISQWDVSEVVGMTRMLDNSDLSVTHYDAILNSWSRLDRINSDVSLGAAGLNYCNGLDSRSVLVDNMGWTITGDIEDCTGVTNSYFVIDENSVVGTVLGTLDYANAGLQDIRSATPTTDNFSIDLFNLSVIVEDSSILDYETSNTILFGVTIEYEDGSLEELFVNTSLNDVNDAPVIQDQEMVFDGNSSAETLVGTVIATDQDAGDVVTYAILDGNIDDAFELDSSTGELTVKNEDAIAYEANPMFVLRVEVTDVAGLSNEATVELKNERLNYFITTWQTTTANEPITIPTGGDSYSYRVDWGDGSTDETVYTGDASHSYASAGIHTVSIYGDFPRIYFYDAGDKKKIMTIEQWGNQVWSNMSHAFTGCNNLTYNATDVPDLSKVFTMDNMFNGASQFNGAIGDWDVSNVTNMYFMFNNASSFNQPLDNWDVSHVTDLAYMFYGAASFDQDISSWDVSHVNYMYYMFFDAESFNQDLSTWHISSVFNIFGLLDNSGISVENYDAILIGWSDLEELPSDLTLGAENMKYCNSEEARTILIDDFGWTITGDSKDCIQSFIIDENLPVGEVIGLLSYNVEDDAEIISAIPTLNEYFSVDLATKSLIVEDNTILDFEMNESISFEVILTINDNSTEELSIDIQLNDIDEPAILSTAVSITNTFIYPNPVRNILHISSDEPNLSQTKIQIIDLTGHEIMKLDAVEEVDVSVLKSGLYILRLIYGLQVLDTRFMKY